MIGMIYSGVFEHDGHFVSFRVNDYDVEINDTIFSRNKWHTREKKMDIDDAIEFQRVLIKFGYEHNLNLSDLTIRLK
jgi:hypothetical protein